ncbi:hypothetical protein [Arthrobacter sp. ES1]|uniref:hypothetical protein n=1 Tax=Arthrobacter sp. ES1 TaxID=1897056 RepID=UPI001CFFE496|nr:hypothetical protein [Arthrobacter sp. ES1]MCB5280338.1 hypothetical protein [Arthrobacter sp. ES1]
MPRQAPSLEFTQVVTTVEELDAAPKGHLALDKNLLAFTKPFHESNKWLLGGFTEKFPASAISLPARLYKITTKGLAAPAAPQSTGEPEPAGDRS